MSLATYDRLVLELVHDGRLRLDTEALIAVGVVATPVGSSSSR